MGRRKTSRKTSREQFPLEIIELIIDEIGYQALDRRYQATLKTYPHRKDAIGALSAVSILCKATLHRCRYWIFFSIRMEYQRTPHLLEVAAREAFEIHMATTITGVLKGGYLDCTSLQLMNMNNAQIVAVQNKRPGDYIRTLLIDFTRARGSNVPHAVVIVPPIGLLPLLTGIRNLEILRISAYDDTVRASNVTIDTIGWANEVRRAIRECIKRNPLRRCLLYGCHVTTELLLGLPSTLESLSLLSCDIPIPLTRDQLQTPMASSPLTGRVEVKGWGGNLTEFMIAQMNHKPGPLDEVKSLLFEVAQIRDDSLLPIMLNQAAKTLETFELDYSRNAISERLLSFSKIFETPSSTITDTPAAPLLPSLRAFRISTPKRAETAMTIDDDPTFPVDLPDFLHMHLSNRSIQCIKSLEIEFNLTLASEAPQLLAHEAQGLGRIDTLISTFFRLENVTITCRTRMTWEDSWGAGTLERHQGQRLATDFRDAFCETRKRVGDHRVIVTVNGYDHNGEEVLRYNVFDGVRWG